MAQAWGVDPATLDARLTASKREAGTDPAGQLAEAILRACAPVVRQVVSEWMGSEAARVGG